MPARFPDWPELLAAFVESRRAAPFVWGENDCVMFAADCALAITGNDPAIVYRGSYSTAAGAARIIKKVGDLAALVDEQFDQIPVAHAGRGDWVLVHNDGRPSVCVVLGAVAAGAGEHGLSFVPMTEATMAWMV